MLGTFNNNVLTMAAGRVGLEQVFTPAQAEMLHARGEKLRKALQNASQGTSMQVTGYGSVMCFHFSRSEASDIKSPNDLRDDDKTLGSVFHLFMLEKGFYIARRGFLALSLALTDEQLSAFVAVVQDFLRQYGACVSLGQPKSKL